MPELPEVETVRRSLIPSLEGAVVRSVDVVFPGCIHGMAPELFRERIIDRRIEHLRRMGKYLIFVLDDLTALTVHLRMTGQLRVGRGKDRSVGPYTRLVFRMDDGRDDGIALYFDDQRKFGRVTWHPCEDELQSALRLGPEPIDEGFSPQDLHKRLAGRTRPIKSLLLDQQVLAGIGNIYADEALFRARIHPARPAGEIDVHESERLWEALRAVLHEGLTHKGTTLRDYVDGDGRAGSFQTRLHAYGREGEPCERCGGALKRLKIGGRSSFHCAACQS